MKNFFFYLSVNVVEEDNETEWTTCHGLSWDEGVLEGGLSLGLHHSVQRQSCELHKTDIVKNTQLHNYDTVRSFLVTFIVLGFFFAIQTHTYSRFKCKNAMLWSFFSLGSTKSFKNATNPQGGITIKPHVNITHYIIQIMF